jgi:hypothetical protein
MEKEWKNLTVLEKKTLVQLTIKKFKKQKKPPFALEISEAVGAPSKNSIIGFCDRNNINLPILPGGKGVTSKNKGKTFKFKVPRKRKSLEELRKIKYEKLGLVPPPTEGIPMSEAWEIDGCRYIIGDLVKGEEPLMCGKPLDPDFTEKKFCPNCMTFIVREEKS